MGRALVLNASESPLAVVAARRAVVMVLKEKADVVLSNGLVFHSAHLTIEAPSVVRLRRYVHVPYRPHAPLTRRAVFARDLSTCQYCGAAAENLDHVIPRSRGGLHTWENVVASCRKCNARKEDRTPQEAGFSLLRQPYAPRDGFHLTLGRIEPGWELYLASYPSHRPSATSPCRLFFRCSRISSVRALTKWSVSGINVGHSGGEGRRRGRAPRHA
jgi:5-methylcytosine-specific restriction endonuclease McrA